MQRFNNIHLSQETEKKENQLNIPVKINLDKTATLRFSGDKTAGVSNT